MNRRFDITGFGARPGGETLNTAALQAAIDACHAAGGGAVLCPAGEFVTGSLLLKSGVTLHLADGCRLVASPRRAEYPPFTAPGFRDDLPMEGRLLALIRAAHAERIAITGPGEVFGSGPAFYDTARPAKYKYDKPAQPRPRLVVFFRCRDVRVEDAAFLDSPCYAFWLMQCEQVRVQGIRIRSSRRLRNSDGIDVDACRDVVIRDCHIDTEDDCLAIRAIQDLYDAPAVCERIAVSNCRLDSATQGVRIGCPNDGIIRHCVFSNLVIRSDQNGIRLDFPSQYQVPGSQTAADIHDIRFSDVDIRCQGAPVTLTVRDGIRLRRLAGLTFDQFRIRSGAGLVVAGCPETLIRDVRFSDIRLETPDPDPIRCRYGTGITFRDVTVSSLPAVTPFVTQWRVGVPDSAPAALDALSAPNAPALRPRPGRAGWCDLRGVFNPGEDQLIYLACSFVCPERMRAGIGLGYDGPVKLWLDGQALFCDPAGKAPMGTDKALIPFDGAPGAHEVLIALVSNGGAAWGVRLRFQRRDITPEQVEKGLGAQRLPEL